MQGSYCDQEPLSPVFQGQGYYPGMYGGPMQQQQPQQPPTTEVCQISVPNSAVGAIIGAGGSNIKQIIRDSNAFVTVSTNHHIPEHFKILTSSLGRSILSSF